MYKFRQRFLEGNNPRDWRKMFNPPSMQRWFAIAPATVDNFYTRSLLGEQAFRAPALSLTATDTHAAKQTLLQIDVLLVLEEAALNQLALQVGLGWEHGMDMHSRSGHVHLANLTQQHQQQELAAPARSGRRLSSGGEKHEDDEAITREVAALLPSDMAGEGARANKWDMELYQLARMLAQLDAFCFAAVQARMVQALAALHVQQKASCGFVGAPQHNLDAGLNLQSPGGT